MAKHRLDDLAHRDDVDAQVGQHAIGRPLLDPEQSEQQMLRADVRVMGALGLLLGEGQAHFGLLVEALERVHRCDLPTSLNRLPLPAGERVGERAEKEVHVLLTNACLWLGNQSNLSAWGALWICSRRLPGTGFAAPSTGRRRGRDAAGRGMVPAAHCSWPPPTAAGR